ncbi:MAG: hypothetical protein NW703_11160 [Nitrospiraceae bacterium]
MTPTRLFTAGLLLGLLSGCATPPEVKQALVAKDQAYQENARLMEQYRELLENVNHRFASWHQLIETRLKLSLALKWATTDPFPSDAAEKQQLRAETAAQELGPEVVKLVNNVRLADLPARSGPNNQPIFTKGTGTMSGLVQALPGLVALIDASVEKSYQALVRPLDTGAYDDYRTNIAALRRINATVKEYLDIDVTVKPDDIRQLAEAIKAAR